jgi:hypothetical protein
MNRSGGERWVARIRHRLQQIARARHLVRGRNDAHGVQWIHHTSPRVTVRVGQHLDVMRPIRRGEMPADRAASLCGLLT